MSNYWIILTAIVMLVVFFVFVLPSLSASISNMNDRGVTKNIQDGIENALVEYCGLSSKLSELDKVLESINPETLDERTTQIYWDFGNEISKCDMWYFYQQLSDDNKRKLNWLEFACNVNDCLDQ